jgi:hypothetical protein
LAGNKLFTLRRQYSQHLRDALKPNAERFLSRLLYESLGVA